MTVRPETPQRAFRVWVLPTTTPPKTRKAANHEPNLTYRKARNTISNQLRGTGGNNIAAAYYKFFTHSLSIKTLLCTHCCLLHYFTHTYKYAHSTHGRMHTHLPSACTWSPLCFSSFIYSPVIGPSGLAWSLSPSRPIMSSLAACTTWNGRLYADPCKLREKHLMGARTDGRTRIQNASGALQGCAKQYRLAGG